MCVLSQYYWLILGIAAVAETSLETPPTSTLKYPVKKPNEARYLFYDVNPTEGFNLRADVYLRFAVLLYKLRQTKEFENFKLVLPPWSIKNHWGRSDRQRIPWANFYDLKSLKLFVPVIELHEYFDESNANNSPVKIDEVYHLKHIMSFNRDDLLPKILQVCKDEIKSNFLSYENITSNNKKCLSFHGDIKEIFEILRTSKAKSILFDRAEKVGHLAFGDETYWKARRSMRFNKELKRAAAEYRRKFLNSTNTMDGIEITSDWRCGKPKRKAKGGPYLAVHLRRRDFISSRQHIPSIKFAAQQIRKLLQKLHLDVVFVASYASESEFEDLVRFLPQYNVMKFKPNNSEVEKYKLGGIAIIEQIICSHARYFVGTFDSKFSYKIQEEREIFGFPTADTFNMFCGDQDSLIGAQLVCEQMFTNDARVIDKVINKGWVPVYSS